MDKRLRRLLFSCCIASFISILACGTSTATPTDAPPTPTVCPPVSWTPLIEREPIFLFVLIDGTYGYYKEGNIDHVKETIRHSFLQVLQTGDRVVIGWIRDDTQHFGIEQTIFYDSSFVVEADTTALPLIPPSPTSYLLDNGLASATPPPGQLKQTEVARTIDAAKTIEAASIQQYFCDLGESIVEINRVNDIIESIRVASASQFVDKIHGKIPGEDGFEGEENNPIFESISRTADFINNECNLSLYDNCMLLIYSDLHDFRTRTDSDKVPLSDLNSQIDIITVSFDCRYKGSCDKHLEYWNEHFSFFKAKSITFVLNSQKDEDGEDQKVGEDLSSAIHALVFNK